MIRLNRLQLSLVHQQTGAQYKTLRECPGPTYHACTNVNVESSASAWHLIIDNFILTHIRKCTINKAFHQIGNKKFILSIEDLETLLPSCMLEFREKAACQYMKFEARNGELLCQEAILRNRFCKIL